MGGENYIQKSTRRQREIAALEQQAAQELAQATIDQLPGHIVDVKDRGMFTALEVNTAERIVYCWRESEPDHVWPIPFGLVYVPLVLKRGPLPQIV